MFVLDSSLTLFVVFTEASTKTQQALQRVALKRLRLKTNGHMAQHNRMHLIGPSQMAVGKVEISHSCKGWEKIAHKRRHYY